MKRKGDKRKTPRGGRAAERLEQFARERGIDVPSPSSRAKAAPKRGAAAKAAAVAKAPSRPRKKH